MKTIIKEIVKHIIEKSEHAEVESIESKVSNTIAVRVCGCDQGRMIGEKGRTVNMFKRLMEIYTEQQGKTWRFFLGEPLTQEFGKMANFREDPDWDCTPVKKSLETLIRKFSDCEVNVIKVGGNVLFEASHNQNLSTELQDIIGFLAVAMCKGYGKTCNMEWFLCKK